MNEGWRRAASCRVAHRQPRFERPRLGREGSGREPCGGAPGGTDTPETSFLEPLVCSVNNNKPVSAELISFPVSCLQPEEHCPTWYQLLSFVCDAQPQLNQTGVSNRPLRCRFSRTRQTS